MKMNPLLIFKALADETRIRLMNILSLSELNVYEITTVLDMGQSRISRHLKILAESGLLESRRDGLWVFYRAARADDPAEAGSGSAAPAALCSELLENEEHFEADRARLRAVISARGKEKAMYFEDIAPEWDDVRKKMVGSLDAAAIILPLIEKNRIIADLGCGTGGLLEQMYAQASRVIGIDSSDAMIAVARKRFAGKERAEFRIGELEHLPVRDGEADVVIISMVLHYLDEPARAIEEACRALSGKGSLFIIDLNSHNDERMRTVFRHRRLGFEIDEIKGWIKTANMDIIKAEQLPAAGALTANFFHAVKVQ